MPPVTGSATPVMYPAAGEHRNVIALAMSSGSPGRRIAILLVIRPFISGSPKFKASVAVPQVVRLVLDRCHVVERPGVIDEDVEAAELLDDLVDHGLDLFTVRDVHLQRHGAAAHLAYVVRGLLGEDRLLRRHQLRKGA